MTLITKNNNTNNGFVLLFAVTLSSILLAVALGVANITLKELNFSTSARDTNDAFFAADVGVECALLNDKPGNNSFVKGSESSGVVLCHDGDDNQIPLTVESGGPIPSWSFIIPGLGSSGQSCTMVYITKDDVTNAPVVNTTISSKGFNIGDSACASTNPNRIERELKVTYSTNIIPAPVAYWRLEETTGPRLDSSGANHLTPNGAVTSNPGGVRGNSNEFIAGDPGQWLFIPDNPSLSTGEIDFSIAAWVRPYDLSSLRVIAAKRDSSTPNNTEWLLLYDPAVNGGAGGFRFYTYNAAGQVSGDVSAPTPVNTDTWYLVMAWRDSSEEEVNIQVGESDASPYFSQVFTSIETAGPPIDTGTQFRIGRTTFGPFGWWGRIDEVGFWKVALTSYERQALWNNGIGQSP